MASQVLRCPHCSRVFTTFRTAAPVPEAVFGRPARVDPRPPSPPGEYHWAGNRVEFDVERIASRIGRLPDTVLAREISCSADRVRQIRLKLGIPKCPQVRYAEMDPLLGKLSDADLARHFSVCRATVRNRRHALGIPPYARTQAYVDRAQREYVEQLIQELSEAEELV